MRLSCWSMSEVLRRERVSNMWPTWTRSRAWSPARLRAWLCRSSTARASWPISSVVVDRDRLECRGLVAVTDGGNRVGEPLLGDVEGTLVHTTRIGMSSERIRASTMSSARARARPR